MLNLFSIQFEILPSEGSDAKSCFNALQKDVENWVLDRYQNRWGLDCRFPSPNSALQPSSGHSIDRMLTEANGTGLTRLLWRHPDERDTSLSWTTEIILAHDEDRLQLASHLRVGSSSYVVRPAFVPMGRPRVITEILSKYRCWSRGRDGRYRSPPAPIRTGAL
jgi:hypothetical protein